MDDEDIRRLVAEIKYRWARRLRPWQSEASLVAVYDKRRSEARSIHGLVIESVHLILGARDVPIPFGIKGLAIIDVLVRYRPSWLCIAQIERILRTDPICVRLGPLRLMDRRVIKVYLHRVRKRLARAFEKTGVASEPKQLIASENTELANAKGYRLAIHCRVVYRTASD